jgi:hypothetical protein
MSVPGMTAEGVILQDPAMTILPDALRAYEQELLQKAEVLALGLGGLRAKSPERAAELLDTIMEKLEAATLQDGQRADAGRLRRARPIPVGGAPHDAGGGLGPRRRRR